MRSSKVVTPARCDVDIKLGSFVKTRSVNVPQVVVDRYLEIEKWLRDVDRFSLPDRLEEFVQHYVRYKTTHRIATISPEETFYRARINSPGQNEPYPISQMGAPPQGTASSGRINPEGMSYLYLADYPTTAIAEVRPWKGAVVSVGTFRSTRQVHVASLMPPNTVLESAEISEHGMGLVAGLILEMLYFSTPAHRDDRLSYLPTQYIASKFKKAGMSGVQFGSVLHEGGVNTAIFETDAFVCEAVNCFEVKGVKYEAEPKSV